MPNRVRIQGSRPARAVTSGRLSTGAWAASVRPLPSAETLECDVAHELLEAAHRHEVLGPAPRSQPGAVAPAPEGERQGLQPQLGYPREKGEGQTR